MFGRIGRFAASHAKGVLLVTALLAVAAAALGVTAFGKLQTEGFDDPNSESSQAKALIESQFGGENDVVFLFSSDTGSVDDPAAMNAAADLADRLATDPGITGFTSYFTTKAPPMISADGQYAIGAARLTDEGHVKDLRAEYSDGNGPINVQVGGADAIGVDISGQVAKDLALAEAIAVPIILVLLVVVFGSVIAALLPLAIGTIAVFGTFALLAVLGSVTDVSVFAINLTTALGLGLAIDYALLMVSRFREELAKGKDTPEAVVNTVETAGRTIVFSALTVAVALGALALFPLYFLRSFAYAGMGVVIIAMVSALFALPAMLALLGERVNSLRLPWAKRTPTSVSALWAKVAGAALKRPVLMGAPVVLLLVLAAVPLLKVEFGTPDDRVLTGSVETRAVGDVLRADFPGDEAKAIQLVTRHPAGTTIVGDYALELSRLAGVESVTSSVGTYADGRAVGPGNADFAAKDLHQRMTVLTEYDSHSTEGQALAEQVRDMPSRGMEVLAGGSAARLVDSKDAIADKLPLAAGIIAVSTFILLFLFSGSVLQPLRALLFNVIGLSATIGLMVMIFQEGWLASWLGFTPLPLDTSMLVLLFCVVFGLSMDYEVFVLSRIKEMRDQGADLGESVKQGLSRTGRLVTMAAVLLAVSLLAFGTSGVSFVQMFGIGSGLAILVDATLIRGVLVPVGMRALGKAAWWSPPFMRKIHDRIGLREHEPV
ncbi:MMPL family transporter [Actinophytocola algeriensis]|uniref:RND superfamily putative drug exporter n=1 Tax=Actinophytocola algeriensis TaxID=1768010 RepID=A0A7W7Q2A5_9PSEU|nr:MMPL family transporter [Actinophytocola algeriensis]MBB4905694.1 RND superfamily putative drug exporter [Actinophytocola algeriensis]MBE1472621.1 RND superfamily putative drug exporter [Actinophytocola algeriensis]